MGSSRQRVVLTVLAVFVVVLAGTGLAGAARPAPAERSGSGGEAAAYLAMYPAVVEKARQTVEMLMARLPAGPSPKGPGH